MKDYAATWQRIPAPPGSTIIAHGEHIPAERWLEEMPRPRQGSDYDDTGRGSAKVTGEHGEERTVQTPRYRDADDFLNGKGRFTITQRSATGRSNNYGRPWR